MAIPKQIQALLDKLEGSIKAAVLESIRNIKSRARYTALVDAITAGDVNRVFQVLDLGDEFFEPLDEAIRSAYIAGGRAAIESIMAGFPRSTRLAVVFSGRSSSAEDWMRRVSSRLISEISASTREAIRGILTNGLADGRNPRSVALDLIGRTIQGSSTQRVGGVIGLNSNLTSYLESARRELSGNDMRNYLTRALRDKRYDSVVLKAIESGKPLSQDMMSKILSEYSDSLLRYRAEMIARTEATAALNASRHEAMSQAVSKGAISEEDIARRWRTAGDDGRRRDTHADMEDQKVLGLKEPFISPSGARMMHPGDTSLGAPAEEVINCRCYEQFEIDYIAAQARLEKRVG